MTLEQIIQKSVNRLESVPDTFLDLVNKQNDELWKELLKALKSLEVVDGKVIASSKNIAQLNIIAERMRDVLFGGDYLQGVKQFITEFDEQAQIVNAIYQNSFDNFTDKSLYNQVLNQSKRTTLALFDSSAVDKAWIEPLTRIINDNVLVEGSYNDLINILDEFVRGSAAKDATLSRYVQLYARDSFNIFNRSYTQIIANEVGVEYFEYYGGSVKDSRDFCLQRTGRTFDRKTIESWASLSWQGKRAGTDKQTIFAYCGGYNCIHSLIPRSKKATKEPTFNEVRTLKK